MLHHVPAQPPLGAKVLVADDDDDLRAIMASALRADGYSVVEAHDGVELLALIAATLDDWAARPDAIVVDVRMPHISGLGVLDHLQRAHVKLPSVVITGLSNQGSVDVIAKKLGAIGVLHKPFDIDDLRTALLLARS
jgi:CheY-like chemotaxis protein